MTGQEFAEAMKILEGHYKPKTFPLEAKKKAWERLNEEPVKALMVAGDRLILEFTHYMPPMQKVIDICRSEGQRIRKLQAEEQEKRIEWEKNKFKRGQEEAFKSTGIAKDTVAVVLALQSGKITRQTFLDGIRHLDNKYPGAGFATEGAKLSDYYQRAGLPLNKYPRQKMRDD
jgi:hypothetical protein